MTNRINMCINCFQRFKASTLVIGRFSTNTQQQPHHISLRSISLTTTNYNHYLVLGVGNNATDKEIKKAYLAKCQKYHPDKHPENPTMHSEFVKVNESYQVLGNKTKRREYDNKMNFYRGIPNRGTQGPKEYNPTKDPHDVYEKHRIYKEFYDDQFGNNRHNIPNLDPFTSAWNNFKQRKESKGEHADKKFILRMYFMVALVSYFGVIFAMYVRGVNSDRMTKLNRNRALQSLPEDHPAVIQFHNSLKGPRTLDLDKKNDC